MNHPKHRTSFRRSHSQRGAALVMGLLMLVVVTLLAVSATNTASSELIMAGNEQNRQRAFQAADAGLEPAIVKARDDAPMSGATVWTNDQSMSTAPNDQYDYSQQYVGDGSAVSGGSIGKAAAMRFGIMSRGESPAGDPRASRAEVWVSAEFPGKPGPPKPPNPGF
jgi:type II secretory pathway component PulK